MESAGPAELAAVRRRSIGFVFQQYNLFPALTALENVAYALQVKGARRDARPRAGAALEAVGLADHAGQRPSELSGGQQQRVGLARALVAEPELLLADEPTGQLDSVTGAQIMELLVRTVHERRMAAVVATHDPAMMDRADRVLQLHDGRLTPA